MTNTTHQTTSQDAQHRNIELIVDYFSNRVPDEQPSNERAGSAESPSKITASTPPNDASQPFTLRRHRFFKQQRRERLQQSAGNVARCLHAFSAAKTQNGVFSRSTLAHATSMGQLSQATIWPSIRKTNAATSALVKWAKLAVGFSVGGVVACSFFYALHASRIASRQTAFEAAFVRTNRAFVDAMLHEVAASQASLALHTPQTSCWLRRVFNGGCVAMRQTPSCAAAARYAWTVAAATRSSSAVAWAMRAAASVWRVAKEALQRGTSAAASLISGRMAAKVAAMQLQPVQ